MYHHNAIAVSVTALACILGPYQAVSAQVVNLPQQQDANQGESSPCVFVVHPDWANGYGHQSLEVTAKRKNSRDTFAGGPSVSVVVGKSIQDAPADALWVWLVNKPWFSKSKQKHTWSVKNGRTGTFNMTAKSVKMHAQYELWHRTAADARWRRLTRRKIYKLAEASDLRTRSFTSGSLSPNTSGGSSRITVETHGEYLRMNWRELEQVALNKSPFSPSLFEDDVRNFLGSKTFASYTQGKIKPKRVIRRRSSTTVRVAIFNRLPFAVKGTVQVPLEPSIDGRRGGGTEMVAFGPIAAGKKGLIDIPIASVDEDLISQLKWGRDVTASVDLAPSG